MPTLNGDAPCFLFVYGTLMPHCSSTLGAEPRLELAKHASVVGAAMCAASLFDRGRYPVMIEADPGTHHYVYGVVLRLNAPDALWPGLDAYEGISDPPTPTDEYRRVIRPTIITLTGLVVPAWVYLFCGDTTGMPPIVTGRWPG
jgi:gamma-glutamylcyclotransferase (GGCT)/AIG2-like uncharacterized protein YtfP